MWFMFFLSLALLGRRVSVSEFLFGKKTKETEKSMRIRLVSSEIESGSLTKKCGCRVSKEGAFPCQAHRAISSAEGN